MAKKMEAKGRENFLWNSSRYMFIWRVDAVPSSVICLIYLNRSKEVISRGLVEEESEKNEEANTFISVSPAFITVYLSCSCRSNIQTVEESMLRFISIPGSPVLTISVGPETISRICPLSSMSMKIKSDTMVSVTSPMTRVASSVRFTELDSSSMVGSEYKIWRYSLL